MWTILSLSHYDLLLFTNFCIQVVMATGFMSVRPPNILQQLKLCTEWIQNMSSLFKCLALNVPISIFLLRNFGNVIHSLAAKYDGNPAEKEILKKIQFRLFYLIFLPSVGSAQEWLMHLANLFSTGSTMLRLLVNAAHSVWKMMTWSNELNLLF